MRTSKFGRLGLTALFAGTVAALFVSGMSGGTTQAIGPGEFVVVDSTGKQLGILLTPAQELGGNFASVAVPFQGNWYVIEVWRDSIYWGPPYLSYFTTGNCSGQAYARDRQGVYPAVAIKRPDLVLYVPSGSATSFIYGSRWADGFCDTNPGSSSWSMYPVVAARNLNVFTPPFRFERTTSLSFFQADTPLPELP